MTALELMRVQDREELKRALRAWPEAFDPDYATQEANFFAGWLVTAISAFEELEGELAKVAAERDRALKQIIKDAVSMDHAAAAAAERATEAPIPILLWCPKCNERHIDVGEFATKIHTTHACQKCGVVWRPAVIATVGVEFLPGFKDGEVAR